MPRLKRKCTTASKPDYAPSMSSEDESSSSEEEIIRKKPLRSKKSDDSGPKSKNSRTTDTVSFKNLKKSKVQAEMDDDEGGALHHFDDEIRLSESGSDSEFEEVPPEKVTKIEEASKYFANGSSEVLVHGVAKGIEKVEKEEVEMRGRMSQKKGEDENMEEEMCEKKDTEKVEKKGRLSRKKRDKKAVEKKEDEEKEDKVEDKKEDNSVKEETEEVEKRGRMSRKRRDEKQDEREEEKAEKRNKEYQKEKNRRSSRKRKGDKPVEEEYDDKKEKKAKRTRKEKINEKNEENKTERRNRQSANKTEIKSNKSSTPTGKINLDDSDFEEVKPAKKSRVSRAKPKRTEEDMPQLSMEQIAKYENADEKDIKAMLMTFENGLQTSDKDESDWEEVEEGSPKQAENTAPVEITVDAPNLMRKKKKKTEFDMMEWFRLQINRFRRETQLDTHKVHLLCLVAHGRHINHMCSHPPLQALCLSLVPMATASLDVAKWDLKAMNKFMSWFNDVFTVTKVNSAANQAITKRKLMRCIQSKKVTSTKELVMIYVTVARSLGHEVRIVHSLQPVSFKATDLKAKNGGKKSEDEKKEEKEEKKSQAKESKKVVQPKKESKKASKKKEAPLIKNSRQRRSSSKVNYGDDDSEDEKRNEKTKKTKKKQISDDEFVESETEFRSRVRRDAVAKATVNADLDWWAEVYLQSMKKWICVECVEGKVNYPREQEKKVTAPMAYVVSFDSDFAVKDITKKYAKNWMSYTRKLRVDEDWWKASLFSLKSWKTEREALEDAEIEASFIKQPLPTSISDYKNHPLYALRRHLLKFEALYPDTAVPVGFLKNKEPVYARECVKTLHSRQNWLKEARLVRIGEEPYKIVKARMTPRRAKVYDGKSEPMLEIFGFWQTEEYIPAPAHDGKVPRNEYGNVELFRPSMLPGGTVHLKGMPGLNRIARKLNIDCAAAMTGWSLHGGHNHPVMDGWVVCVEHKDILLAAWDEEQEIAQEKEREKKEKRVYANWKLLIRSALVRERLKHRYETFKHLKEIPKEKEATKAKETSEKPSEKATDAEMSWPRKLQEKSQKKGKKSCKTSSSVPFPFEVETM